LEVDSTAEDVDEDVEAEVELGVTVAVSCDETGRDVLDRNTGAEGREGRVGVSSVVGSGEC